MPTSSRGRAAWMVCLMALAVPAHAQVRVDAATEVRSLKFSGNKALTEHRLAKALHTRARGPAYGFLAALGKLPLVPDPGVHPFSPLTLQEDVVRLRGLYAASGFFRSKVRYEVRRDDAKNLLDITFLIQEGIPTVVGNVVVQAQDSLVTLPVPTGEAHSWESTRRSAIGQRGARLVVDDARQGRDKLEKWWRNRGFPRASVVTTLNVDSTGSQAQLTYRVSPGSFARFGKIHVEGAETISDVTVGKMVDIHPGEPYSQTALEEAELDLQKLDIVRVAKVDVPELGSSDSTLAVAATSTPPEPTTAPDSIVSARIRITEADRRLIGGDVGYVTDAGFTSEARWSHRNFSGGGRVLTLTGLAQTGWLALVNDPDKRYRLAVSLKQPAFGHRYVSGVVSPFIEHRDDSQDLSTQVGTNLTAIYQRRTLNSVSLDYQIARRRVDQYRFNDLASGDVDLFTFLVHVSQGLLDSLGAKLNSSTVTLSGTYGLLDDAANPRQGVIVRPAFQVTAPTAFSSTAYWRIDASANAYLPLGRAVVIASRAKFGQIFPFGKSVPDPGENPRAKFLQLHDVAFTAGGTGDVRGWENRLLGPKVPDVRFETVGDSLVPHTEGYDPYGGLARASFSVEARMPIPRLGPNFGSLIFLDGGRVWTADERYGVADDPNGQQQLFLATGGGFALRTPVGPIEISAGYKLNPSITDLVDAQDLLNAAQAGRPIQDLPQHSNRRWQFHLAIGTTY